MQEISWRAPEFIHYPKSFVWYGIIALLGLVLAGYFLLQKDFLTAVLFVLLFVLIVYFAQAKPKMLEISLDAKGLKLNEMRLPYQQIKTFWFVYEPPEIKTLNFETTAYFNRFLTLQLEDQDPVKIREFLLKYLPEDLERAEFTSDKIARKLRF